VGSLTNIINTYKLNDEIKVSNKKAEEDGLGVKKITRKLD